MKKRILIAVPLIVLAGALAYILATRPPQSDLTQFSNLNDTYDVTIYRDTWGVPHVFGKTDADTAFGLAYAHAEDDLKTIQGVLAAARGELALYLGQKGAPNDFMVGLLNNRKHVKEKYESDLSPETRRLCRAYADGLNFYASRHPDMAWKSLYPMKGEDIAAGFVHKVPLFFGLEKTLGKLFEAKNREELEKLLLARNTMEKGAGYRMVGSNTFALAPGKTADGSTFLAVNSHQPWEGPVAWYEAHLRSEEGWDMAGGVFPGSPVILHGHNRDLGWAHTVNHADLHDIFVLETDPEDPERYRVDGKWLRLEKREVPIKVKLWGPLYITVKKTVYDSIFGPVLKLDHGTYAVRFPSMGDIRQVEQWYRMNRAKNFGQWRSAMEMMSVPCFNSGYADREGNIFYLYNSKMPLRRSGYDWKLPVPGNTKKTLWKEYISFSDLPMVKNPPSGFIQNCNSTPFKTTTGPGNPDPENYAPEMGIETHLSNRAIRARELFGPDSSVTWEEFYGYKYDMKYSSRSRMASYLEQISAFGEIPAELAKTHRHLLAWDLGTEPDNIHTALAILTLHEPYENEQDTLTREEYLSHLRKAEAVLEEHHGSPVVPWQNVNRIIRGDVNMGMGGGPDILHAVYGDLREDGTLKGHTGDSLVMLVRWDRQGRVTSRSIHQYGSATSDPASPHYADQVPLFVKRKMKDVLLEKEDILENLERAYRPGEEKP